MVLLAMVMAIATVAGAAADTNLQFYMHDNIFVPNPSGIAVAGPNGTTTTFAFGTIIVIDDALTATSSPSSRSLGRGQGTYMVSALDMSSLLLTFTAILSDYNGTLSFHGADKIIQPSREIAVVGGTGVFRFAHGYADITTISTNQFSAVLHFNVTVRTDTDTATNSTSTSPSTSSNSNSNSTSSSNVLKSPITFFTCLVVFLFNLL